jgi:molecular chaperone HtpG
MTQEKNKFDAEIGKVLQLMIHSIYTNKEIFMRELISNSSDACDKLRYISQTEGNLIADDPELKIYIKINKDAKTISIRDNGIGMNKEDLKENLGTIAKSGTQSFLSNMSGDSKKDNMLIGQFGVGFYSAFMVSNEITVTSRKAGEDKAYVWNSDGNGEYTVSDIDSDFSRGTEILLHIKDSEESFLDHFRLKHIVKNYSDHIAVPIYFTDDDGVANKVNSSSALWMRSKNDIEPEQYKEFYKNVSFSPDDPWIIMHNKNEGAVEFTNLLFIPSTKTFDLFHPDRRCRVKLYIKRVFITDEKIDIIPQYLRFLRGVIDSEDLPLNISRETLQHNSTIEKIKNSVTKKVLNELKKKKDENLEEYLAFWSNFGAVLKEGLCEVTSDHEKLLEVCVFRSALHDKMISFDEYLENCQGEDKTIYYLSGEDADKLKNSPQIEGFLSKGIDVLLFTDTVDDFWVNVNGNYKGAQIKSVTRADIDLDKNKEGQNDENKKDDLVENDELSNEKLISYFKESLGSLVKDVKISKKLTLSPACLSVGEGAMDIRMERFLIEQKQLSSAASKILEVNPNHKIVKKIVSQIDNKEYEEENKQLIHLLFDQACVIEGQPVEDAGAFAKRLNYFLEKINV